MTKKLRSIGVILRNYRIAAGLSQEKLAIRLDVTTAYVCMIESGKRNPSLATIIRFADALEVSPGDIVNDIAAREKALEKYSDAR